jgi:diaminopimelate decarboxylase
MDPFHYQNNTLMAEDVAVADIAAQHGTPCFIYSRAALEDRLNAYEEALAGCEHLTCFAVKANSNLAVLNVLARLGAGFDIVSGGELERVITAGGDAHKVIFSGLGKTEEEIARALQLGIRCFNIESEPELDRINTVATRLNLRAPISLRVNPDVDAGTHPYISTGLKENKFGIAIEDAEAVYMRAASMPAVEIVGVDCHIGSQLTNITPYLDAIDRVLILVDRLASLGIKIRHFDMGGGLGVRYKDEVPPPPAELIGAIRQKLAGRSLTLFLEPGRSICANAGIFVTHVEYLKLSSHKNFAIVDGAMNDLLRPALYSAWQEIVPVQNYTDASIPTRLYDVVGPVCESADFLGKDRDLTIQAGDLLAVRSAGAYGFVMSSNYNTRNRAAEIMVDGSKASVVRKRETLEYQLSLESILED